jgi:hypothetical protein
MIRALRPSVFLRPLERLYAIVYDHLSSDGDAGCRGDCVQSVADLWATGRAGEIGCGASRRYGTGGMEELSSAG